MSSTPNAPEGLFESIEKEPAETCLYKRLLLDYTYCVGKIYTEDEINAAKATQVLRSCWECLPYKGYREGNRERYYHFTIK
jgi:hypothetical protein